MSLRATISAIVLAFLICAPAITHAGERAPTELLFEVIKQLQEGRPDLSLYSEGVKKTIAEQTNNRWQYGPLSQLGPVASINLMDSRDLPSGGVYVFQARHLRGMSIWTLGINSNSKLIEYANFNLTTDQSASPQQFDKFRNSIPPSPDRPAECSRFPNLC